MSMKSFSTAVRKRLTGDTFVLALFAVVSAYMLVKAFSFSQSAQNFPVFTTSATLAAIGLLLLLRAQEFLPGVAGRFVERLADLGSEPLLTSRYEDEGDEDDTAEASPYTSVIAINAYFIVGFVVLSYLIGMFWAAPVYAVTYGLWSDQHRYMIVVLALLYAGIAYLFEIFFRIGLMEGVLL